MFGFGKKKADVFDALFGKDAPRFPSEAQSQPAAARQPAYRYRIDNGEKFPGGLGAIDLWLTDYWTLRQRSSELFERNHFARGLIRRLVTNEIHTGLNLEATPEEAILGYDQDELADWSETVENRFALWGANPVLCDHYERQTWGAIQATARREALVAGDVLHVLRFDPRTKLPRVQLINGQSVQTPAEFWASGRNGNKISHGVELDSNGRHLAYWVGQDDGSSKRLPAYGEKSGRRLAWLVYGTDRRLDDVRGRPLLAIILQALKELDRYRDATLRKAVVNSMLAMFITKAEEKMGTRPLAGNAIRRGTEAATDTTGKERSFKVMEWLPGAVIDELQHGEEPKVFNQQGTTEGYGVFEEAVLSSIAWSHDVPPETLTLAFSSNYSASQAATNEFKTYLNLVRTDFGDCVCRPVYEEFVGAETRSGKIEAPGLLEASRDPARYDEYAAWISCDWSGNIKPAVKLNDLVSGYKEMVKEGFITRDRATRELTGQKFSKNVIKLKRENEQIAAANKSLEPPQPVPAKAAPKAPKAPADQGDDGAAAEPADDTQDAESLPN